MEGKRYILSTDGLNRNGYRVKTEGIRTENFAKNPVLLMSHSTWGMSIGRVDDIQVEGTTMTGVPVFDQSDPIGLAMKSKVDGGFPIALSIGFRPLSLSSDPLDLLPGQQFETVKECELLEVSVVTIPGNPDAVGLSANSETPIPTITPIQKKIIMEKSTKALGLAADATDEQILEAVQNLQLQAANAAANLVLSLGESRGMVTDANREIYRKLAASDPDSLKAIFESAPAQVPEKPTTANQAPQNGTHRTLAAQIKPTGTPATEDEETFEKLQKTTDGQARLLEIKRNDPERYRSLSLAYQQRK